MKKITPIIAIFSLLILACKNVSDMPETPAGYGRVVVNVNGEKARTVFPSTAFDSCTYSFTKSGGSPQNLTPTIGTTFTLEEGSYTTVSVTAVKSGATVAEGTSGIFTVNSGQTTNVSVTLSPSNATSGTGVFRYNVSYPAGTSITQFTLGSLGTPSNPTVTVPITGAGATSLSGTQNVPSGMYFLTILLENGNKTGGANEVVYIYAGMESAYTKTFTAENLAEEVPFVDIGGVITYTVANADQWNAVVSTINSWGNGDVNNIKRYAINVIDSFGIIGYTANTFTRNYIDVTINNGNGNPGITINLDSNGSLLRIGQYQTVTLHDLTLQGKTGNNAPVVSISGIDASFIMDSGLITGNTNGNTGASSGGGGVAVITGAFTMSGSARISGNTSTSTSFGGGGVYNQDTFTMTGGTISGNTATGDGGGVYQFGSSTVIFTMSGGVIGGNTPEDANKAKNGGGVATSNPSGGSSNVIFNMTGGTISGNEAASEGGGVYAQGPFTMSGGAISGNTANSTNSTARGGGVSVGGGGTFNMQDGVISGNTSNGTDDYYGGGGVFVSNMFNMTGGTISGNSATSGNGGGVGVNASATATFRIVTGTIYGTDESDTALQNTAANGAALFTTTGTAEYGTGSWTSNGSLSTTNDTIKVVNGYLMGAAPGNPGTGAQNDPFIVWDEATLRQVGTDTDGWTLSAHYKQIWDITLTGPWTPIGASAPFFTGTYDGGGSTISGLTITGSNNTQGLFSRVEGGTVKNIALIGVNIAGNNYIGGVAGSNSGGTITNCYVTGNITSTGYDVGGVVGVNTDGTVKNCYSTTTVTASSSDVGYGGVGGVVGRNEASSNALTINCYATGNITGSGSYFGGVVGEILQSNNANARLENLVALNKRVSTTTNSSNRLVGRVTRYGSTGSLVNLWSRSDLQLYYNTSTSPTPLENTTNGMDGANVAAGTGANQYNNQAWWSGTAAFDFTTDWEWNSATNLPVLKGFSAPQNHTVTP